MPIEKILVVEDDAKCRELLHTMLTDWGYDVVCASSVSAASELLAKDTFELMLSDICLPDGAGTQLLRDLEARPQKPVVIMMTGFASVESAVECMRHGAFDYLIKPFSLDQIEVAVKKAEDFTQLLKINQYLSVNRVEEEGYELLGKSPVMDNLRQLIRKVARTQATVLIQGESGTGKELVAHAIYRQSPRSRAPFIRVNCAAVPENLIESEFFGHEKGAFTGAMTKREGRFELAHSGTILLDEISEISSTVQAKLLRVLQERELERVGGTRTIKVDVRVIATTNRKLEESVDRKEFRQDLYFRLNVVPIHVPPLRDRMEDVPLLVDHYVQRFARKHGVRIQGVAPVCLQVLQEHSWPGNVRELQNVIERAVILCGGGDLDVPHLGMGESMRIAAANKAAPLAPEEQHIQPGKFPTLYEIEKRHIYRALEYCHNNRTHAAKVLDISIRTLRNKLNEYNGVTSNGESGNPSETVTSASSQTESGEQ